MKIAHNDPILQTINIDDFTNFLIKNGWNHIKHPNDKLLVYKGADDDEGNPIELVLAKDPKFQDFSLRLAEAINLLAELNEQTPYQFIEEFKNDEIVLRYQQPFYALLENEVNIALRNNNFAGAENLILKALINYPPNVIAEKLRDLLEQIYFQRHLDLRGITLNEGEFQFTISGKAVGYGYTFTDNFVDRVQNTEKLFYRTAERQLKKPFREKGPIVKNIKDDFTLLLSTPRASSFAVSFKVGRPRARLRKGGTTI